MLTPINIYYTLISGSIIEVAEITLVREPSSSSRPGTSAKVMATVLFKLKENDILYHIYIIYIYISNSIVTSMLKRLVKDQILSGKITNPGDC